MSIPFKIINKSLPYNYNNTISYKIFQFINFYITLSYTFTLILITSKHYQKIYKPYKIQITKIQTKKYIIIIIISTIIISLPILYIYNTKTIKLNKIQTKKKYT